MNFKTAIKILCLDENNIDFRSIKRNYYIKALQHHPDKNYGSEESKIKFQEISKAYNFLKENQNDGYKKHFNDNYDHNEIDLDYKILFKQFLASLNGNNNFTLNDISELIVIFNQKYINNLKKILDVCSKEKLVIFYNYLQNYKELLLEKNTNILSILEEIIKNKIKNDERIILNPSIDNLFNDDIYKLIYNEELYYIPLWHNELIYDISGASLFVECIPEFDNNISIDNDNNLFIKATFIFTDILNKKSLPISIGKKVFNIPVNELKIRDNQLYKFENCGISLLDHNNIYNVSRKSDIFIDITLI